MAIKGSLVEASLPEVIQLLSYSLKSGCLSVTDGKNLGNIFLDEGKIVYATILKRKARLGDSMLEKQLVQHDILKSALTIQKKNKGKRLGEILVEMGAISQTVLDKELKQQIEEAIHTMLSWKEGYFNFEVDLLPSSTEKTVSLSSQDLLLGSARLIQDWQKIEEMMPPRETVLTERENMHGFDLTPAEEKVLSLVDGASTVDEVIKESNLDYQEACKAIYVLLVSGLVEKPKRPAEKGIGAADIDEYKTSGLTYFQSARYDEAEMEFERALHFEPDDAEAHFYLGLIELKRHNDDAAKDHLESVMAKGKRVSVLIDVGYLCNRLGLFDKGVEYLNEARAIEPDNVKVLLNLGIINYNRGVSAQAADDFARGMRSSDTIVTPYTYLAAIHVGNNEVQQAIELLTEAVDRFPRFLAFKNNLGLLNESIGRDEDAENLYRQALSIQPNDKTALRNLADLYYRSAIYGAARECYERIPESERDITTLLNLGRLYLLKGESDRAIVQWQRVLQLNPGDESLSRDIEILSTWS
ncbi:MAG: tetratricopeptide repeat protein [candidate division WOR-3 bacterium]|nr:MAG: tetratricopeptide repeat protein [candidate division WOR-3 bacterium]